MILECPSCQTRYLISANLFSTGPRQVRCARCAHSWQAELPPQIDAVGPPPDADVMPPPDAVTPIPVGSNLPVLRKRPLPKAVRYAAFIGLPVIALLTLLTIVLFDREEMAASWPSMEIFYAAIGMPILHYGEGLGFVGVRSELRYEGGKMLLDAEGSIHNGSKSVQQIPPIRATAIGVDGKTVKSWQIAPPAAKVSAGEDISFRSSIDAPKDAIAEINLTFVENNGDEAGQQQ